MPLEWIFPADTLSRAVDEAAQCFIVAHEHEIPDRDRDRMITRAILRLIPSCTPEQIQYVSRTAVLHLNGEARRRSAE